MILCKNLNSLRPSDAYVCQLTWPLLVQKMACRLVGAKHYLYQWWNIVNWTPGNKFQWNFNWNSYICIQENAVEHVIWKMAAILSQPQCVKLRYGCSFRSVINSSPPGENGRHFTDNIFKCIYLNENVWFSLKISMKFVPVVPLDNNPALV